MSSELQSVSPHPRACTHTQSETVAITWDGKGDVGSGCPASESCPAEERTGMTSTLKDFLKVCKEVKVPCQAKCFTLGRLHVEKSPERNEHSSVVTTVLTHA